MIGSLNVKIHDLLSFCNEHSFTVRFAKETPYAVSNNITGVEPIDKASQSDISFCRFDDERALKWIEKSEAGFLFIPSSLVDEKKIKSTTTYICAPYPRLALLKFIDLFWEEDAETVQQQFDIHPRAKIGRGVKIGRNTVIGPNVEIGDFSIIGNNATINHAIIGTNCEIGSCVSIGGSGFGFEDEEDNILNFPHLGDVIIGNNVRIGSSTCIDRASLGSTIIEDKVKIDNLVHIAHNVSIGQGTKVIAMSIIGGSTKIGTNSWIAPGVSMRDWINIGSNSLVGLGAVVTKDVGDDVAVVGNPAKPIQKTKNRYR